MTNATLKKGMLMSGSHIDPVSLVYVTGRGVTGSYGSTIFVSEEMNIYNMYICVYIYIYRVYACMCNEINNLNKEVVIKNLQLKR